MSDILSNMGDLLSSGGQGLARIAMALGTGGRSEFELAQRGQNLNALAQVGDIMAGNTTPAYATNPGPDQLPPEQIQANKLAQIMNLKNPAANAIATQFLTPAAQIAQQKLPSEIGVNQAQASNLNAEASLAPSKQVQNYAGANASNAEASLAPAKNALYKAQTNESYVNAGKTALMQKMAALIADPNTDATTKQQAASMLDMQTAAKQTLEGGTPTQLAQNTKDMEVGQQIKNDGSVATNTIQQINEIKKLVADNPGAVGPFVGSDAGQLAGKVFNTKNQAAREQINNKTAVLFGNIVKNGASGIGRLDLPIVNSFKDQTAKLTSLNPDVFNANLDTMLIPAQKMVAARTAYDMSGHPEVARLAAESNVDTQSPVTKTIMQPTKIQALIKGGMSPQDIIATLPKVGKQENIPTGGNIGVSNTQAPQQSAQITSKPASYAAPEIQAEIARRKAAGLLK